MSETLENWQTSWKLDETPEPQFDECWRDGAKLSSLGGSVELEFDCAGDPDGHWVLGDLSDCETKEDACRAGIQIALQSIVANAKLTIEFDYLFENVPSVVIRLVGEAYLHVPISRLAEYFEQEKPTFFENGPGEKAAVLKEMKRLVAALEACPKD